jgi:hypothetical protein
MAPSGRDPSVAKADEDDGAGADGAAIVAEVGPALGATECRAGALHAATRSSAPSVAAAT